MLSAMQDSQVMEPPASDLMTPGDAAALLGVTTTTLATWGDRGRVAFIRLPSGHRRYLAGSVHSCAEQARTDGAA
jgi:predicted site-specific integrase-resolvase